MLLAENMLDGDEAGLPLVNVVFSGVALVAWDNEVWVRAGLLPRTLPTDTNMLDRSPLGQVDSGTLTERSMRLQ